MKKIIKIFILLCIVGFALPQAHAQVSVGISVGIAPPPLPVYVQPECPVDGYIWQPGYWAYDDADGYYWVPGAWVAPPNPGYYWTPAYWGFSAGVYGFHSGYWGPHIGFYGGINYGYGYSGHGYYGGRWDGDHFRYNTAVVRVNRTVIHNTYVDRRVIVRNNNRTSFNGGRGGVTARPRPQERVAMRERHVDATPAQRSHQEAAHKDRSSFAKVNHGRPAVAADRGRPTGNRNNPQADRKAPGNKPGGNRPERQQHAAQRSPAQPSRTPQREARPAQQRAPQQRAQQPQRAPQQRAPQQRAPQQRAPQPQRAPQQQRAPQPQRAPQQRAPQPQRAPQQRAPQQRSAPRPAGGGHEHHR
ncbi:YXWGXW repeat-containing protein [Mucilaginibacter sp. BJC16-A38]|uniref:YXWGXW repeat-containing protein n=1 Tax=Mucilaginibacter phenanthrenivorans TaxID=1234842 RepID=UPI002157C250|nr:YXWGXW repeat-containing protein [Mucilaginibacter phenanthrenivorans]MCR8557879.1 YXWGXW repeat-containing protein [Mucilaginibacter phenanthrenivorans]